MGSMGALGEQILLGAGELQKLSGIPEPNFSGQLLVQSLAIDTTSGIGKSMGEISYLGKVVNIFLALRSEDFKPLDERRKGKVGFIARRFDRSGYLLSAIAAL